MANKQPKPPKVTVYAKNDKQGISSLLDNSHTKNFVTDRGRNLMNLGGSIGNWFGSRADPKYGPGDYAYGTNPATQPAPKKTVDNFPWQQTGKMLGDAALAGVDAASGQPVAPTEAPKTLADYLLQAKSMGLGGGGGTNYDGLINQLRANGASGDAKLAAMYDALARSNAADSTGIAANFDSTGAKLQAAADTATKNTGQAYNSTRDAQTAQLSALGIGNAAGVLAANGGQAARDQNIALGNIAQNNAAVQTQNTAHAANAQQYNTGVVESNRSRGVEARSSLQQQLATKLAELESAKASAGSNGAQQAFDNALKLQSIDPKNPTNVASAQQAAEDRQLKNDAASAAIQKTLAETSKLGSAQTLKQTLSGSTKQYANVVKLAAANGVNTADTKAMSSFIQSLIAAGKLG